MYGLLYNNGVNNELHLILWSFHSPQSLPRQRFCLWETSKQNPSPSDLFWMATADLTESGAVSMARSVDPHDWSVDIHVLSHTHFCPSLQRFGIEALMGWSMVKFFPSNTNTPDVEKTGYFLGYPVTDPMITLECPKPKISWLFSGLRIWV